MNKIVLYSSFTLLLLTNNSAFSNDFHVIKHKDLTTHSQTEDYYKNHPQKNKQFLIEQNKEFQKKMHDKHIDSDHLNDTT
jgi:hypothetical protein